MEIKASVVALSVGQAWVEAAMQRGGLAVFLCAEEYLPDFRSRDQRTKDEFYCHRFTLARLTSGRFHQR